MRIPKHSKKVFSGKIFSIYQWKQKLFDGSTAIFERAHKADTIIILPIVKGKIVICKERQPDRARRYYSLLGGRIDPGESPRAVAKRELLEESGLVAKRLVFWKKYDPLNRLVRIIHMYIAKDCSFVQKPSLDAGEKVSLMYVTFEKFIDMIEQGKIDFLSFENDVLRMDKAGTLKEFKKLLLD